MKDLYQRIGLTEPTQDPAILRDAISSCPDRTIKQAAECILLNSRRKEIYDRSRAVLVTIGQLRANLGLSRAQNWIQSNCSDFDVDASAAGSQLEDFRRKKASDRSLVGRWVMAVVVIIALIWVASTAIRDHFRVNSALEYGSAIDERRAQSHREPEREHAPSNSASASGSVPLTFSLSPENRQEEPKGLGGRLVDRRTEARRFVELRLGSTAGETVVESLTSQLAENIGMGLPRKKSH